MESLFYCTQQRVTLPALTKRLFAMGLIDYVDDRRPMTSLVYRGEAWFSIHESPRQEWDTFEEPQLCVLRAEGIQSVFQIDCRLSLLDAIRPQLVALIRSFDGWIGLDDGAFSRRLPLADLEEPEGLSRRVVAMTGEDA